jgi:hypothetical protein
MPSLLTVLMWACVLVGTKGFQLSGRMRSRGLLRQFTTMQQGRVPMVPYYPDKARKEYQWMDIYNALGRTRTLFVGRFLDDEACNQIIASLVWLNGQSATEPITLYFNVPGALGKPAWAVFDTMRRMKCPIITINTGTCFRCCLLFTCSPAANAAVLSHCNRRISTYPQPKPSH